MGSAKQLRNLDAKRTIAGAGNQHLPIRWIGSLRASKSIEKQIEGQDLLAVVHVPGYSLAGCCIPLIVQDDDCRSVFARVVRLQPDAGGAQFVGVIEPVR